MSQSDNFKSGLDPNVREYAGDGVIAIGIGIGRELTTECTENTDGRTEGSHAKSQRTQRADPECGGRVVTDYGALPHNLVLVTAKYENQFSMFSAARTASA